MQLKLTYLLEALVLSLKQPLNVWKGSKYFLNNKFSEFANLNKINN